MNNEWQSYSGSRHEWINMSAYRKQSNDNKKISDEGNDALE